MCWAPGGEAIALAYCNTEYLAYHDRRIDTRCDTMYSNISYILAAGWYHYLASTFEYLNHIYQKKLEESFTMFTLY